MAFRRSPKSGPQAAKRSKAARSSKPSKSAKSGKPARHEAGTEIARLVLRTALGSTMIAHGLKHGRSLDGTAKWFDSIGFTQPKLQAAISSVVEVGAGSALIAGMATPLAASAVVGTMGVAYKTVHEPNGFFITGEGYEYVGFISAAAVALGALGAGRYSLDHRKGLDRVHGVAGATLVAGLGAAGAAGQLKTFWRPTAKV